MAVHLDVRRVAAEWVLVPQGWLHRAAVTVSNGLIERIDPAGGPGDVPILAPGFIDIQINGYDDVDLATSPTHTWSRLADRLARAGVTSWMPTLVSRPLDAYGPWLETVALSADRPLAPYTPDAQSSGPRVLGAHLEGPWLGEMAGAHCNIAAGSVDLDWFRQLPPIVRLVTLAPEVPGAFEAIKLLRQRGMVAALGHSTADHHIAEKAFDAGATLLTHCFNATPPMHHRTPGLAGAALAHDGVFVSLIADGHHVHPDMLRLAMKAKGADRTLLISDCSGWAAGTLGSEPIRLVDGAPRTSNGKLAGSAIMLDDAVRYVVEHCRMPLADALRSASTVPSRLLGETRIGSIRPGCRADLVGLDTNLSIKAVWAGGHQAA